MPPVHKKRGNINRADSDDVAAGAWHADMEFPNGGGTFANGMTVRIDEFGASAASNGDGVSSEILLQVKQTPGPGGWDMLRHFDLDGNTYYCQLRRTWKSDGNLKFRIRRRNNGAAVKLISAWLDGYRKVAT